MTLDSMTTPRRKVILIRTSQEIVDAIDACWRVKQARTKDRVVSRNEIVVSILRRGLAHGDDIARDTPSE